MSLELSWEKTRDLASISYPAVVVRRGSNVDFWRRAVAPLLDPLGNGVHYSRGLFSFLFRSVVLSSLFHYPVLEDLRRSLGVLWARLASISAGRHLWFSGHLF